MQGALTLLYPLMPSSLEDAPHQNLQAHSPHQGCSWVTFTSLPPHGNSMALAESEPGLSFPTPWACCGEIQLTCNIVIFDLLGNYCQVHLFQSDSVKSTLSSSKPPSTRNNQGGCAHSHNCKDGWDRVREEFVSLWKYQSKFKSLHQQWNTADLQAVIQSGDESQNTKPSSKAGLHFCTSTCILYWQKK